jgi:hypothetical protein
MWDAQRSLWMSDQQQVKAAIYNGLAKDVQADYVNRLPSWKAQKAHDIQFSTPATTRSRSKKSPRKLTTLSAARG